MSGVNKSPREYSRTNTTKHPSKKKYLCDGFRVTPHTGVRLRVDFDFSGRFKWTPEGTPQFVCFRYFDICQNCRSVQSNTSPCSPGLPCVPFFCCCTPCRHVFVRISWALNFRLGNRFLGIAGVARPAGCFGHGRLARHPGAPSQQQPAEPFRNPTLAQSHFDPLMSISEQPTNKGRPSFLP